MAFPTILVDSATGSDSAASGAGPATAVTGTKGRTRNTASQLRVGFFEASAPDLSGVLTDGSHALYIAIATAGQRNFANISAVKDTQHTTTGNITSGAAILSNLGSTTGWSIGDVLSIAGAGAAGATLYSTILTVDSSSQVTLNDNAGTSVTGNAVVNPKQVGLTSGQTNLNTGTTDTAWAIGGKRASIGAASSAKLFDNNGGAGDAMPGWIVEMQSGHAETIGAQYAQRRAGNQTSGRIELRGAPAAATRPILTFSHNGTALAPVAAYLRFAGFELRNTNATKTTSVAIQAFSDQVDVENVKISHSTNKFWKGIFCASAWSVRYCEIGYCANIGLTTTNSTGGGSGTVSGSTYVFFNYIHDCGSHGIFGDTAALLSIYGNIIANNAGDGINAALNSNVVRMYVFAQNTIYNNTGDGIELTATTSNTGLTSAHIVNNILSSNGGYGLNFSNGSMTKAILDSFGVYIGGNNTYSNTSGPYNPASIGQDDPAVNPSYTDAANGDFSIGSALKALGVPLVNVGRTSSTRSYVDPGAAQRQEPSGSGGPVSANLRGGFVN